MNMHEANQLSSIYNTLLMVHTSGRDTKIMGKCLDAFETFLSQVEIITDDEIKDKEG